jgi:predicted ester cyclase
VSTLSDAELNKHLIRSYTQVVFNERQTGRAAEFLGPDVTWNGSTGPTVKGRDKVSALIREVVGALNGLTVTEQYMIAEGDTVAVRYLIEATGSGELFGIPASGHRPPDPLGADELVPPSRGQDRQRGDLRRPGVGSPRRRRPAAISACLASCSVS